MSEAALSLVPSGGRVPPHDLDAEAAVLSAVLLDADAFDRVQETLAPEHFYADANRRVYEAVLDLKSSIGQPVDIVSVATWLRDRNRLAQVGGTPYLAQLADATPAVAHVENHARIIKEKWRTRQLIATCQHVAAQGYAGVENVQEFIDAAEQAVFDIARVPSTSSVVSAKDAIHQAFDILTETARRGGGVTGIETGFTGLDRLCSGLHRGDLYVVAARPGMGKTAFVLNLAVNIAEYAAIEKNVPAAIFTMEMSSEQMTLRMISSLGRVSASHLRTGQFNDEDWSRIDSAVSMMSGASIFIDDSGALTPTEVRARARRLKREHNLGLIVVDYLQLMQVAGTVENRATEISEISRSLKALAKELDVPVIALSQLSRAVEQRNDRRPLMSDLRESGAIEQDADVILFIYREEVYAPDKEEAKGRAEVIIGKQRNGPIGTVSLTFLGRFTRFANAIDGGGGWPTR